MGEDLLDCHLLSFAEDYHIHCPRSVLHICRIKSCDRNWGVGRYSDDATLKQRETRDTGDGYEKHAGDMFVPPEV